MIKVLYFGVAQDVTGTPVDGFEAGNTAELNAKIIEKHPGMRSVSFRMALNGAIISGERDLVAEDIIAVLPPFAGG